jgi:hypothetical protein
LSHTAETRIAKLSKSKSDDGTYRRLDDPPEASLLRIEDFSLDLVEGF